MVARASLSPSPDEARAALVEAVKRCPFKIEAIGAAEVTDHIAELLPFFTIFAEKIEPHRTVGYFLGRVVDEVYQVWAVRGADGALVAAALSYVDGDRSTCVISHCAGKGYKQWSGALLATIRVWSLSIGSTKLEAVTRPGWGPWLRQFGMVKSREILELRDGFRQRQNGIGE